MAGVEFGILEEWSETSLMPQYRIDLSELEFRQLTPVLELVSVDTGIDFDLYSAATLHGDAISLLIGQLEVAECVTIGTSKNILQALIRSAQQALLLGRPFQYRGL